MSIPTARQRATEGCLCQVTLEFDVGPLSDCTLAVHEAGITEEWDYQVRKAWIQALKKEWHRLGEGGKMPKVDYDAVR